jgi:hypothetical protein
MKKTIASLTVLLAAGLFMNAPVRAGSDNGVAGAMPALYDGQTFLINLKEVSDKAADSLIANNASINTIYECDSCPGFIAVLDAIQGDGFNPLWLEVQIEFINGTPPRQLLSDDDIADAEANHEIQLSDTGEVYRCSVIGKPQ